MLVGTPSRPARALPASRRPTRLATVAAAALALGFLAAAPSAARAGLTVNSAGGRIEFGQFVASDPPAVKSVTATVPGTGSAEFAGATALGEPQGLGHLTYDLSTPAGGLSAALTVDLSSRGFPYTDSGSSRFVVEFTTDQPVSYRFNARVTQQSPQRFVAALDGVTAEAQYTSMGELVGTIPVVNNNGQDEFGEFLGQGVLQPGTHTFSIEAFGFQGKAGGGSTFGAAELTVAAAVPLPPAAATGLATMAVAAGAAAARRRRAAAL